MSYNEVFQLKLWPHSSIREFAALTKSTSVDQATYLSRPGRILTVLQGCYAALETPGNRPLALARQGDPPQDYIIDPGVYLHAVGSLLPNATVR